MIRSRVVVLVVLSGFASVGCVGSSPPAADTSNLSSRTNPGPDISTGPGAGEPTDATPDTSKTGTTPNSGDNRSTGSSGPDMGSSNEGPSASPVH